MQRQALPSPSSGPSVTSTSTPFQASSSSTAPSPPRDDPCYIVSRPLITHAMLLMMGHLSHSADVRASRLEAEVRWMIERPITAALTPLKDSIDALTTRVKICERDNPSLEVLAYAEVPVATTGNDTRADVTADESESQTDDEQLEVRHKAIYEDMANLEGAMFETARQPFLRDIFTVCSSRAKVDETTSTVALTNGATEMQTSPRLSLEG
uniref:Polyprotein protein n=1 Tax=Solanum tuberosum TaxID=4113 RepID=M1DL45_SOLTU